MVAYLLPGLLLVPEAAQHSTGDGSSSWFLNTSHGHAHVAECQ